MATYQTLTFQDDSVLTASTSTVSFLGDEYTLTEQTLSLNQTIGVDIGAGIEPVGVKRVRRAASLLGASYTQNEVRLVPASFRPTRLNATYQTLTFQDDSVLTASTSTVSFWGAEHTLTEQTLSPNQTIGVDIGAGIEPVGVQRVRRAASLLGASYTQDEVRLVPISSSPTSDRFHTFEYKNQAVFEEVNAEDRTIRGASFRVTELRIDPDAEHAARIKPGGKNKAGDIRYDIDRR